MTAEAMGECGAEGGGERGEPKWASARYGSRQTSVRRPRRAHTRPGRMALSIAVDPLEESQISLAGVEDIAPAKAKLDELFLTWLSKPETQALVAGFVEDLRAGRPVELPVSSANPAVRAGRAGALLSPSRGGPVKTPPRSPTRALDTSPTSPQFFTFGACELAGRAAPQTERGMERVDDCGVWVFALGPRRWGACELGSSRRLEPLTARNRAPFRGRPVCPGPQRSRPPGRRSRRGSRARTRVAGTARPCRRRWMGRRRCRRCRSRRRRPTGAA